MTCLRVLSDLHLEFGPLDLKPVGEDVLVLAGDVWLGTSGADWAARYSKSHDVPVLMIAGNHEFYGELDGVDTVYARLRSYPNIYFIQDEVATVDGVRFAGATLWTDYELGGNRGAAMTIAQVGLNDHRKISERYGKFRPETALTRHLASRKFLETLPPSELPTVIVTHHLPSRRSLDDRYDPALNPAYASNLDDLVERSGAAVWVHGHTHTSRDYRIGRTRVVCNPRGYYPHGLNPAFDPNLVIEI